MNSKLGFCCYPVIMTGFKCQVCPKNVLRNLRARLIKINLDVFGFYSYPESTIRKRQWTS